MDYGKFKYEKSKKEKEQKKRQHQVEMKEIRLRPKTDVNDLNIKIGKARQFLEARNKVKITVMFRGRELAYKQFGYDLLKRVEEMVEDIAKIEVPPKMEGRNMHLILTYK